MSESFRVQNYCLHILAAIVGLLILSGCSQPVFVGFSSTPEPEEVYVELAPGSNAPVPRFGPFAAVPQVPIAGRVPAAVATLVPSTTGAATTGMSALEVSAGPAFMWSETENYLILGTDHRAGSDNWRTDTIIVVGLDRKLNRAAVLSIPRDLYLEIPNYGYGRINQVDYIGDRILKVEGGGPALVSTVLSQTLGIATQHWLRFEMTGFQDVVNAVGGVTMYLDCPFYEPIFNLTTNSWEYFTLPAGEVYMDGETAYWYVRLRLRESDIGRSARQRQFLWALRDQMLNTNILPKVPELWSVFRGSFSTDLTLVEMLQLMQFGLGMDAANVRASGITLRELQSYTTEQGASVLIISDPARVQAVVEGVWAAPAMVDSRRQNVDACASVPDGAPAVASDAPAPQPTPILQPTPAPLPAEDDSVALPEQTANDGG